MYKGIGDMQNMRSGMERYFFRKMKVNPRLLDGSHRWDPEDSEDGEPTPLDDEEGEQDQVDRPEEPLVEESTLR